MRSEIIVSQEDLRAGSKLAETIFSKDSVAGEIDQSSHQLWRERVLSSIRDEQLKR